MKDYKEHSNTLLDQNTSLDELYRLLYKKYSQSVDDIDLLFENPAIIRKRKGKKVRVNKVISTKNLSIVIDFSTSKEITVEVDTQKTPHDDEVTGGKIALYDISLDIGDKLCKSYYENKESVKDIYNAYNLIMVTIAAVQNLPAGILGIVAAIIAKIGIEKYCKNRGNIRGSLLENIFKGTKR